MSSHHDDPALEKKLEGYRHSEDFQFDVGMLENEYQLNGGAVPTMEELCAEALNAQREWLAQTAVCEKEGHQFTETADAENGVSDLECERCGMTYHCQW